MSQGHKEGLGNRRAFLIHWSRGVRMAIAWRTLLHRRWLRRLLFCLGIATLLLVLALGAVSWRLAQGPVDLGFLEARLDAALEGSGNAPSIQVRNPVLTWGGWDRPLHLRAGPISAIDPEGRIVAEVDEVSFGLGFAQLLRGSIAPTRIDVSGLEIQLVRVEGGRFAIGFEARDQHPEIPAKPSDKHDSRFLSELLGPPDPSSPLGLLTSIHILESQVSLEDRLWQRSWMFSNADLRLERSQKTLKFSFEAELPQHSEDSSIRLRATYNRARGHLESSLELVAVDMPGLTHRIPGLEILSMFDHPSSVSLAFSAESVVPGAESIQVDLREARFDLGDLEVLIRGTGALRGAVIETRLTTTIGSISASAMNRYWPSTVAPEIREWLTTNISDGDLQDLEIQADMTLPVRPEGRFEMDSISGEFAFSGLSVAYLRPLPPLEELVGAGLFRIPEGIQLQATEGRQGEIELGQARITIGPLSGFTRLELEADLKGPLRSVMQVLDTPPLELLEEGMPQSDRFSGTVDAHLELDIPLSSADPTPLAVSGTARTATGGVADWPTGYNITQANLDLAFDLQHLEAQGTIQLNGAAVELDWWEGLSPGPLQRKASGSATLSDADRLALGVHDSDLLVGALGVEFHLVHPAEAALTLEVAVDLTPTALSVPRLGWSKPSGVSGRANLQAELDARSGFTVEQFKISAGDLRAEGSFSLEPEFSVLRELVVDHLSYADNEVSGRMSRLDESTVQLEVSGSQLDLRPLLTPERADGSEDDASTLPIRDFEVRGTLTQSAKKFSIPDLSLRHGRSDLRGSLTVDRSGTKPSFAIECRSDTVDLRPYFPRREQIAPVEGGKATDESASEEKDEAKERFAISDEPLTFPLLERFDGSIHWKVDTYIGPAARTSSFDIGVELEDGRLRVDPFRTDGKYGGDLRGSFELRPHPDGYAVESRLEIEQGRLRLAGADDDTSRWPTFDLELEFQSHGRSLHDLASHLDGQSRLVVGEGALPRSTMDYLASDLLVQAIRGLNPNTEEKEDTQLECAVLILRVAEGEAIMKPFALQSARMTVVGSGTIDLATEELKVDWITKPRQGIGLSASTLTNRNIRLGGTLSEPSIEVRPIDAAVTTGVAVATLGLSLVARGLYDRITADQDVCAKAMEDAAADEEQR